MAAVMQAPHITHAHTVPVPTRNQRQGILLNPSPSARYSPLPSLALNSVSTPAQHQPSTQSLASTSSSSSASPSPSSSATNTPPPSLPLDTHLTFRALALANRARSGSAPAGRRIRFAPLPDPRAENEEELDEDGNPSHTPSRSESSDSLPTPECPTLLLPDTPTPSASSLATFTIQATPLPKRNSSPCFPHASANTTLAKKLFRPFLLRNPPGADQLPGLGLFKTASRESSRSRTDEPCSSWGAPLGRWTSESAVEKTRRGSTSSSKSAPVIDVSSAPATPRRATRLLNGRVYGGRRKKRNEGNAFANAKDEDEFVEWGYGGMGSVRAGAGVWSRLQSDQKVVIGALEGERGRSVARPATAPAAASGDGDDGSGMSWVRKRREERERKAKEDKEKAGDVVEEKVEVPVTAEPEEIVVAPAAVEEKAEAGQHVHTAVSVPAPYYRPYHHARTLSMEGNGTTPTPSRQSTADGKPALAEVPAPVVVAPEPEEEDDDDSEEDDDEDEEEVDDEEQNRKTALGAGVEIVGRHAHHRE